MTPTIFFTGASGYIGGDVLNTLLAAHPEWEESTTCLLRDQKQKAAFLAKWPKLKFFHASLDDGDAIEKEVTKYGIVLHFAVSSDHVTSCQAIIKGLYVNGGHYIHTGGMDVLLDPSLPLGAREPVHTYDDWDGIRELKSLPHDAPHRDVDELVLAAGSERLKTAIVCPSTVYGVGRGPASQRSDQVHKLTQLILKAGHGLQLGDGKTFWSAIHIYDLSRLYLLLVEEAVAGGRKATWNELGYYLAESGEFSWGDISSEITKEAYAQKLIASDHISSVPIEQSPNPLREIARPIVNYTARSKALRGAKLLGWQAKEGSLADEIANIVRMEAQIL